MELIKNNKKHLCSFLVALLLVSSINIVCPFAKTQIQSASVDEKSSVDLTGGIITAISNSRFLSNLPVQTLYVGDSIEMLSGSISAVEEQTLTIEKDGSSYTKTITVDWNEEIFDTSAVGNFDLVATIVTPEGVTFAPGVMTQIIIPITVIDKPEVIEITSLTDYGTITSTVLIPVSDAAVWEQTVQNWYDYYSYVWGVSDNDEGTEVVLENLDISQVDYTTPGNYTAVLFYQIPDYNQDYYTLAENLQTVYIPVKVSDPTEFELVINHFDTIKFTGSYIYEPAKTLEFFYIATDQAVDVKLLDTISGQPVNETMGFASEHIFRIFVESLQEHMHYYFFGKDGENYSNYVHIYNDNSLPNYDYMEGDRDGGDSSNNQLPDYDSNLNPELPIPSTKPSTTPPQTPNPTQKPSGNVTKPTTKPINTSKPFETVTKPHITVNPIHPVAKPQENSDKNASDNPDTPSQSQISVETNTSSQPQISAKPNTSSQPQISAKPNTSSQPQISAKPDTSSQSQISAMPDSSSQPQISAKPDSSDSDVSNTKEEPTFWTTALIIVAIIVILVILIELIILSKRRKH